MASRLQLSVLVLLASVLATSALRGALFRNGRSFIRNQTPMSIDDQVIEEPAKRFESAPLPMAPSPSARERLLIRQLLSDMMHRHH